MAFFNTLFENSTMMIDDAGLSASPIVGEAAYMEEAVADFDTRMTQLESAMYIADVQLETTVFEGTSPEALEGVLENALTDFIDSVKKEISRLWTKLVDFITKIRMNLKSFMATSANFVAKHKGELEKKASQASKYNFKYSGYKYNLAIIEDGEKLLKTLGLTPMEEIVAFSSDDHGAAQVWNEIVKLFSWKEEANDVNGVVAIYQKACRDEQVTDEVPDGATIKEWITTVSNSKKILDRVGSLMNESKRHFDKCEKTLNEARKKANKENKDAEAAEIRKQAKYASTFASASTKIGMGVVNIYAEYFKAYTRRLKQFYTATEPNAEDKKTKEGTKESFAPDSLLASAFEML